MRMRTQAWIFFAFVLFGMTFLVLWGDSCVSDITDALGDITVSGSSGMDALTDTYIWIGDASNDAVGNPISGDATLANDGELTIAADSVALTTDTTGNYLAGLTAGTAIDVGASGEGASPQIDWDSTEVGTTTWGSGSSIVWTFDASGGSDSTLTFGDATATYVGTLAATTLTGANVTSGEDPGHTHTASSISDVFVLIAGDTMTGDLILDDNNGASPQIYLYPQDGPHWSFFVENTGDDLQIEVNTANTETVDIINSGAGVADLVVEGSITGTNVTSGEDPGHTHTSASVSGFLADTGDIGTGVYDFGGTDSFEITNGANPTVNATGEIALDTTDDQLVFYGALTSTVMVLTPKRQVGTTIVNPDDSQNWLFPILQDSIYVTDIYCIVDPADAGESVVITIQERDSTGDNPAAIADAITCDNDGANDGDAINDHEMAAGNWWSVDIGTVTGTVTQVSWAIYYLIVRE